MKAQRKKIDQIDSQIIHLLDERARLAREIGEVKRKRGTSAYFDPTRQKTVVRNALARAKGEFPRAALKNVMVEIMSACLSVEAPPKVAYLGPHATFSHIAALREFGSSSIQEPYGSIEEIFQAVSKGQANFGIVPIENSTGGIIHRTLDLFIDTDLNICSEVLVHIQLHLIGRGPLSRVKVVYSHPQPFLQCSFWLQERLLHARREEVSSTTRGVELAKANPRAAAIGSDLAARMYKLKILARGIEDEKHNTTRFLVIGRYEPEPSGHDKTSLMFSVKDRPGALFNLLKPFAAAKINLSKIESRPTRRKAWDYVFFLDLEGHRKDKKVAKALEQLSGHCDFLRVLGSYPCDDKTNYW
ncbi:MAG: prephenate dehydratase [bacterium]